MAKIAITGSGGLVGKCLARALERLGHSIVKFDRHAADSRDRGDVLDPDLLRSRTSDCSGIVHLAAVSRVVWGERDPEGCWRTNVEGTRYVLRAAGASSARPWVMFSSSREVYGQPERMPVAEDDPLQPMNIYGRSKAEGERLINEARASGLCTSVVRLANVYGRIDDHADRVVPAFARAAAAGRSMSICGRDHTFDFNHVNDTVRGLALLVQALEDGMHNPPPIHFVSGIATTLGELATLANAAGGNRARLNDGPMRAYDVAHFIGDPSRARSLLGWQTQIPVEAGVARLVEDFRVAERHPHEVVSAQRPQSEAVT